MATTSSEKILVVENDPIAGDLIARQALKPMGYHVSLALDGASAIQQVLKQSPDVILIDLNLPGLSGKDLMVALQSQNVTLPIIVMAEKGQEAGVIQAFRLGASDYLMLPAREAEVVSCVERALKHVRESRSRELLDARIKQTNAELQRRVRDLGTIFSVGRAVISITDQRVLFDKLVEAVTTVTEADMGWLMLKDDKSNAYVLAAHRNLPDALARKLGQPIDDGLSQLVSASGETLSIHGQPLRRFKIAALGQAAMVVPVKVKSDAIGLLIVVRKAEKPFGEGEHTLSEAIADYASISMVNARLFRALAHNAEAAQQGEKRMNEAVLRMQREIGSSLVKSLGSLDSLLAEEKGAITAGQKQTLDKTRNDLKEILSVLGQQVVTQSRS
jgi:DNA-binding response OmpR family regulator